MFSIKNKLDLFHNIKTTYTNWNTVTEKDGKRHPKTFDSIHPKLIQELKHPEILFARKFTKSDIGNYLLEIYKYFDQR